MANPNIIVLPFSEENLSEALTNKLINKDGVKKKKHFIYLLDYLRSKDFGIEAKTILIELFYTSRSYLSDYATYYSLCFKDYDRFCKRVHFFSEDFDIEQFEEALAKKTDKSEAIWQSYLGYIVVKPLPEAIIGPTVLKHYDSDSISIRKYTATKEYHISLFGKELLLKSLVYQEQDTILSACATAALWSAFHKTSQMFQTAQPSPSDITRSAGNLFINYGRTFPNHGLASHEVCRAIESIGLVSELRNQGAVVENISTFKAFVYSYLRMGLPILLGLKFSETEYHLITICGYRETEKPVRSSDNISLLSEQIDRFYAHDDQIGPFSRLGFAGNLIETSWWLDDDINKKMPASIHSVIVPLHPKIRITYEEVYQKVALIDAYLFYFNTNNVAQPDLELIWDVYLDYSNNFKTEILNDTSIEEKLKKEYVFSNMPRFIWRAVCYAKGVKLLEIVFDATDINRGFYCHNAFFYDEKFKETIKDGFNEKIVQVSFEQDLGFGYLNLFSNALGFTIL